MSAHATPAGSIDWRAVRARFPAFAERVWLDTATLGLPPPSVIDELERALAEWSAGRASWQAWDLRAEDARAAFARWIGAPIDSIALVGTLSAAAAQIAERLDAPRAPGARNLVVGEDEFQSNLFPWMNQERRGFEVRRVRFRAGALPADDLAAAIDARTALVAVSAVQSASGYRVDLERVAEAARAHGARVFVDATQAIGALRVPLAHVDALGTTAYKWLLAPRGAAFLYVRPELFAELAPLAPSWKSKADPYAGYYGPPFEPPARASRFDASLAWMPWLGAARALEFLSELGPEAIEARDLELAARFRAGLRAAGHELPFEERESSPIVSLRVRDPEALRARLERERIVAAVRGGNLRTSFHFYNDEDDVDRTLAALRG